MTAQTGASPVDGSGLRPWAPRWEEFCRQHPSWGERGSEQPVYCLPAVVVDALARSKEAVGSEHRTSPAVITAEEAVTEHAFRECCEGFSLSTVGVWRDRPVTYYLLTSASVPPISEELLGQLGWSESVKPSLISGAIAAVTHKADGVRHQQLAFVGWLTFHPPYQAELQALGKRWLALTVKPPWPLSASTADQPPVAVRAGSTDPASRVSQETATFLEAMTRFLRKWNLAHLVTWELPVPQGPLEHVPAELARRILGPSSAVSFVPGYHDVPSGQDVREETRELQRASAKQAGVDVEMPLTDLSARGGHASQWENAFRLWLIEWTALQRYPGRHGLATRLVEAFTTLLGCSEDRVKQLRQLYKAALTSAPPA